MKSKNKKTDSNSPVFKKHKISKKIFLPKKNINQEEVSVKNYKSSLRSGDVEKDLMNIYGSDGSMPDFKTITIKKKKGFFTYFFYFLLTILIFSLAAYGIFNYFRSSQDSSSALELSIKSPSKVALGDEFFYEIDYYNNSSYTLKNINLDLIYPDNFILLDIYSIDQHDNGKFWRIPSLDSKLGGKIKIRGKIINKEGVNNLLTIKSSYEISGLSSRFNRENFNSLAMSGLDFQVSDDYFTTVLVGEEYPLKIDFKDFPFDKMDSFIISFSGPEDGFSLEHSMDQDSLDSIKVSALSKSDFEIKLTEKKSVPNDFSLLFKYRILDKRSDDEPISWFLSYSSDDNNYIFFEKKLKTEVIKSDLHLSLEINGLSNDFPVNFGEELNYTIKYSNKGDKEMKDLVIMAILNNDFLDWSTLSDARKGKVSRKTITWTFKEIPELKDLSPGESGEINFSIKVAKLKNFDFLQKLEINSYAQFSVGNIEEFSEEEGRLSDNQSNLIINPLNSDLSLQEEVLYFDKDNIPVGSGPLPPEMGERTSFRYYWTLNNNLHELKDVKINLELPTYVNWDNSFNLSAGEIYFDPIDNKIKWSLDRWPLGVNQIDINFNLSIIPSEADYNKIMVLSSGSFLEALDSETNAIINKKTDVKTSKLEDDEIAIFSNDGRVR